MAQKGARAIIKKKKKRSVVGASVKPAPDQRSGHRYLYGFESPILMGFFSNLSPMK